MSGHIQAFDGAQHRNRRRDHTVTIEQRRPKDSEKRHRLKQPLATSAVLLRKGQGEQRQDSAFALVVGAHDQPQILDRDQ
jgi:hypothetical protein